MLAATWFRSIWARRLSRQGEHAAALAMCDANDVEVLSAAGMQLSVLRRASATSVERAIALVHLGEVDEALAIARRCAGHRRARALLGMLATFAPCQVRKILADEPGLRSVRAYCETADGRFAFASENAHTISPLHALQAELAARGWTEAARAQFLRLYTEAGLDAPELDGDDGRLDIHRLRLEPSRGGAARRPLISVILTAYNEERILPTAVRSILNQDWENLELLVVDDGSSDGTWDVAEALARTDARVKLLRVASNAGTWRAKNLALDMARGEFITMHDADDWSHPAKLRLQVSPLLARRDLECTSSYFFRVEEATGLPFTRNADSFLRWNVSSLLFRASLVREIGVYRETLLGGDCEYAARIELFKGAQSHLKIRKPLAIGLQRENSLSNTNRHRADGHVRLEHWESWRREHMRVYRNPQEAWRGSAACTVVPSSPTS